MNVKKVLPIVLLILMAVLTVFINKCNNVSDSGYKTEKRRSTNERRAERRSTAESERQAGRSGGLDRTSTKLYFTKHAKCRMQCRQISQQEVKDILAHGEINYNKTNLDDPRGPTYALEGYTNDRQHVRIIFAPKQDHLTVVTVIDLEVEHMCNCS